MKTLGKTSKRKVYRRKPLVSSEIISTVIYIIMASVVLPKTLNYAESLPALPECQSFTQTVFPVNGSSFQQNSQIQFDLGSRGFIDPKSIALRYKIAVTSSSTAPQMIACPLYTPFVRLETFIGGQSVEVVNQYNQIAGHLLANTMYDVASKYGQQTGLGYAGQSLTDVSGNNATLSTMGKMDGRILSSATGETFYLSGPLVGSVLTGCEKLIPAFAMPAIRIQLTLDSISNMFNTNTPSDCVLSNVELTYNFIDFGRDVEQMVLGMGPQLFIKSQGFSNASTVLPSGSSGSVSLVYNVNYSSVKSLFIMPSGTSANSLNKWADSYDPTNATGSIQVNVGGVQYPQQVLSYVNNKAGILTELRRAVGSIYDTMNSLSVNSVEFAYKGNETTTTLEPAKCIVGICTDKLQTKGALMTGISTQRTPISVNINLGSYTTAQNYNVNLVCAYDAIIAVDLINKQVSVKI